MLVRDLTRNCHAVFHRRIMKNITTVKAAVDALGGVRVVAQITGRPTQAVCNWRVRGNFPTVLTDIIVHHLKLRGCVAARELFRLEKIKANGRAA